MLERTSYPLTFGTAAWKMKFLTAEDSELMVDMTTIIRSFLFNSTLVCKLSRTDRQSVNKLID